MHIRNPNHTCIIRFALAVSVMTGSALAYAHAYPQRQMPAAGATVATAPSNISIDFDEGVEPAFSTIDVTDASGHSAIKGKAQVDKANNKHLSVAVQSLAPGVYSVAWVALATDGHRTQGHYSFNVK